MPASTGFYSIVPHSKKYFFKTLFGRMNFVLISLHQFFSSRQQPGHLSRKAEGNGPMKP